MAVCEVDEGTEDVRAVSVQKLDNRRSKVIEVYLCSPCRERMTVAEAADAAVSRARATAEPSTAALFQPSTMDEVSRARREYKRSHRR